MCDSASLPLHIVPNELGNHCIEIHEVEVTEDADAYPQALQCSYVWIAENIASLCAPTRTSGEYAMFCLETFAGSG